MLLNIMRSGESRASALYTVERLCYAGFNFVFLALLARSYDPATAGRWLYALAIVQFAGPFLASGAEAIVVRELIQRPEKTSVILGSAASLIAMTTLCALAIPLAYLIASGADASVIVIGVLAAAAFVPQFFLVTEHSFKAKVQASVVVRARLVSMALAGAIRIYLVSTHADLKLVAATLLVESLLQTFMLLGFAWVRRYPPLSWSVSRDELTLLGKACLPAMLSATFVMLFFRINYVIVEKGSTFQQVSYYSIAFSITQLASMLPSLALTGWYPRLVELARSDPAGFEHVVRWLYFASGVFGWTAIVVFLTAGPFIIPAIFGQEYSQAYPTIALLFLSVLVNSSGAVRGLIIAIGHPQSYHFYSAVLGLVILVPLSVALTPTYGAMGAAAGVAVASTTAAVVSTSFLPSLRQYFVIQCAGLFLLTPFLPKRRQ